MSAVRTCVACRSEDARSDLLRFVADPDGLPCFDSKGALPGRGAWVHDSDVCLSALGGLKCPLRRALRVREGALWDPLGQLRATTRRAVLDSLTLCRRSGALILGFDAVVAAAVGGRLGGIVLAADASDRTHKGLLHALAGTGLDAFIAPEGKVELGQRLGRDSAAVLGLGTDGASRHCLAQLRRLARLG